MPSPLPVELLFHIVNLSLPFNETVSEYGEREKLPASLCLVSANPTTSRSLFSGASSARRVITFTSPPLSLASPGTACRNSPSFGLEHLFLRETYIAGISSIVFRNLVSLTVHELRTLGRTATPLLSAASFPNLKALYSTSWEWIGQTGGPKLLEPDGLDSQLDMLQVDVDVVRRVGGDLWQRNLPVLLIFSLHNAEEIADPRYNKFRHIQLNAWTYEVSYDVSCQSTFSRALTTLPDIQSLSLPAQLHPSFSSSAHPRQHPSRNDLLATCAARKIHVIWRMNSKKPVDDEAIGSKDFWRYAKELKRKKAEEGGGESESL
ncbi:hypothetical protein JCM8547_007001 [Rhodosporidiobolus lusitaniae]